MVDKMRLYGYQHVDSNSLKIKKGEQKRPDPASKPTPVGANPTAAKPLNPT